MKREDFIEQLEEIGAYELSGRGKKFLISEEKTVDRQDGSGHVYPTWEELFAEEIGNGKTIGDLVDSLKAVNRNYHYHLPVSRYDETGDKIID